MLQTTTINGRNWAQWTLLMILGLAALRTGLMVASPLNLHGDEAQYWAWAQDLDWGYFTKPPMIAWVIAATTAVFGDAEWAVRLSSPVLHSVTAYIMFRTGRFAFDAQTGFWAALIYLLMPAVWLSSGLVSTDVPLLLCWVVALNAWLHLRRTPLWGFALQLGLAFGFGFLSKYAMLFFLPALAAAIIGDRETRKALLSRNGLIAALTAGLIITPNIIWNMQNDFATVSHTAANANLKGIPFHPLEWLSFSLSQFAVFGPISLILLLCALRSALKGRLQTPSLGLSGFVLAPLLIISLEAFLSRANANWAVTAYIAASLLSAHFLVTTWPRWGRIVIIGKTVITMLCLSVILLVLNPSLANQFGLANSLKRLRGWPQTIDIIETYYKAGHEGLSFSHIAVDNRRVFFDLNYYGLPETAPLRIWQRTSSPQNQAELKFPLAEGTIGPVLIIAYFPDYTDDLEADFERLEPLDPIALALGGGKIRSYNVWAGYGYKLTTDEQQSERHSLNHSQVD